MPTFIPDRLKTPGDFPSVDANDNQIRGFGYFANNAARTALADEFRCQGYLAFMKDTNQFKQYGSADLSGWGTTGNWTLLEGTSTDTFWAADSDGTGIYRNGQVIVGSATYSGAEVLHVTGAAKVAGDLSATSLSTTSITSALNVHVVIDSANGTFPPSAFKVQYGSSLVDAFMIEPFLTGGPSFTFGNALLDFSYAFYKNSGLVNILSGGGSTQGFTFSDALSTHNTSATIRLNETLADFDIVDSTRVLKLTPYTYKLSSTVAATADVTHGVEMLMPSSVTGDWEFNHLGNKNFVFKTSTSGTAKLQAKFHSVYNGVVSIGSANHYVEYNGLQPSTTSANLQPKLFIVNDSSSAIGIRVQSGDTSVASGDLRLQPVLFTEVRDDGFYISRDTTGPRYNTSTSDFVSGLPIPVIGMRRHGSAPGGRGNSLELFARTNLYFISNSTPAFDVLGDGNSTHRDLNLHSPNSSNGQNSQFRIRIHNKTNLDGTDNAEDGKLEFNLGSVGPFLVVRGSENVIETAGQRLHSTQRGAEFSTFQGAADSLNPFVVRTFNSNHVGADGIVYPTLEALQAAGTTEDSDVIPTNATLGASSVSLSVDGREGHVFVSQRLGVGVTEVDNSYKIQTNGRILAKIQNAYGGIGQWAYNIERFGSTSVVGAVGLRGDSDILIGGFNNNTVTIAKHVIDSTMDTEILGRFTSTGLGLGIETPLAKLHVFNDGASGAMAIGDVAGYNGGLASGHVAGEAPGNLFINGGGFITNGGTNIVNSNVIHTFSNSHAIEWKPGNTESYRQAVLSTNDSSGIAFRTDNRKTDYNFGRYGFSITDNPTSVGNTVDKPLFIKPRFPNNGDLQGYTGGGNDGNGNINQSKVYPLYFTYSDAPSTLENLVIKTEINNNKGAEYDYGLDYNATATAGQTTNPFTANKNRLKISAKLPFAEAQATNGLYDSLSGVIGQSEASFEVRNAYETDQSGSTIRNVTGGGTLNTALYVGGQRFFEPRSRNSTRLYCFSSLSISKAAEYGSTGDLSPLGDDFAEDVTTDVIGGATGTYILSTSNAGDLTLSSSTYDTSVDGHLSLAVTLVGPDRITSVQLIEGGGRATDSTGFRAGDTITIPVNKLGGSSSASVITLSSNSFVPESGAVNISSSDKSKNRISIGSTFIQDNSTNTSVITLGANGSSDFRVARSARYSTYRDHYFTNIEGGGVAFWPQIQGSFVKGAKLIVGYDNDPGKSYDGTDISTASYGTAALRVFSSVSGMRVGTNAVSTHGSNALKFAESDLDAAGGTSLSSTWANDYDTDGGWYVGMPIYVSTHDQALLLKVRPEGIFQYNSGADTSTFQRRIVTAVDNNNRQFTLDSNLSNSGAASTALVKTSTESDLIRCRNVMGRDMFVVKSSGRLDLENGVIKMRQADYTPLASHIGSGECILYWDGTNLKIVKGGGGTSTIV